MEGNGSCKAEEEMEGQENWTKKKPEMEEMKNKNRKEERKGREVRREFLTVK